MKDQKNALLDAIDGLTDNAAIKKGSSILEEIGAELNQYLTIESLSGITSERLKALYIQVAVNYLGGRKNEHEMVEMSDKVERLKNTALGGGWI